MAEAGKPVRDRRALVSPTTVVMAVKSAEVVRLQEHPWSPAE